MKKTKIVCTLGPSSSTLPVIKELIRAGMDVARINFSHGTHEQHGELIRLVRQAARELGREIGVLADIQGPKIRTGVLPEPLELEEGSRLYLVKEERARPEGVEHPVITVDYEYLLEDLSIGNSVYLNDGLIHLQVEKVVDDALLCRVVEGGRLQSRKGVSLPGVSVRLPAVTEKDLRDLEFLAKTGVDFIALSFVRRAKHVDEVRQILRDLGLETKIIAKIENEEGFNRKDGILSTADGIMVARGDLGIELPLENVPLIQSSLIQSANRLGKPVITATEMLESMIRNPRPTRAEVTDVAHAIMAGTDAVMLSAETAVGRHPVQTVEMMARIARRIESSLDYEEILRGKQERILRTLTVADAISHATCQTASDLRAQAIITSTQSGSTARMVSKYRPKPPILAATPNPQVAKELTLSWGVIPMVVPFTKTTDATLDVSIQAAVASGLVKKGDLVIITAGVRTGIPGTTNLLQVHEI